MVKNTEHTLLLSLFNYLCAVEAKKSQSSRNQEDQQKHRIKLCIELKKDFFQRLRQLWVPRSFCRNGTQLNSHFSYLPFSYLFTHSLTRPKGKGLVALVVRVSHNEICITSHLNHFELHRSHTSSSVSNSMSYVQVID